MVLSTSLPPVGDTNLLKGESNKKESDMRAMLFMLLMSMTTELPAQKKWDGGANDGQWNSGANWYPDGVPAAGEDVWLDHDFIFSAYSVVLPAGATTVSV